MAISEAVIRPACARRMPDPIFDGKSGRSKMEKYIFLVNVRDVPEFPLDPNARRPNLNKRIYEQVRDSLFDRNGEKGTFHLKNRGITVVAHDVKQVGEKFVVELQSGQHGIVDGGHTWKLIRESQDDADLPEQQYVEIAVRTGLAGTQIPEVAGGLNTSIQVQDMSLDQLKGLFSWLQELLRREPYFKEIAWSENDNGEYDARDIISLLLLFNIDLYPVDQDSHPIEAYEKKSQALKAYETKTDSFKRMAPIVKDVLRLHDIISQESRDIWNKTFKGRAGNLNWIEGRKKGKFDFIFAGTSGLFRVAPGALYPMLAAFRWYVERDPTDQTMRWRDGFESVLNAWHADLAPILLRATQEVSHENANNPNAVGKSRPHWSALFNRVAKYDLERKALSRGI